MEAFFQCAVGDAATPFLGYGVRYIRGAMSSSHAHSLGPPEHWRVDVGGDSVAVLTIPGLVGRAREFDVDVTLLVTVPLQATRAWLELAVEFDGKPQWNRRIPANNPGHTDGLDYHRRLRLEAEQGVRVRAIASVKGVGVRQLLVEAQEVLE